MTEGNNEVLHEVLRTLGRLEGKVDGLSEEQREARDLARDNRARIHERLDEQAAALGTIQSDIKIGAGIDVQVRNELDQLKKEVEPVTTHVRTLKWIGAGLLGVVTASGASVALAADTVRHAIKSWLG